ncbi:MAG: asparagine synthase-related protein, partial [Gemmatimonadaceae bacterium]
MSAICAVFRRDGAPVRAAQITSLLDSLSEYGPETGIWAPETVAAPVALGCRPWRVTPEDALYRPPIHSADGRVILVADARIDNRMELASSLGISAGEARELPDAAFILAAYQAWEQDCPRRLLGDFAFALWDDRRRSLFCARDGVGQRVLFYQSSPQRLTLATSAHAVATLDNVRPRLNEQKVADFLVLLQSPESTFFEGVLRLPPGHTLTASGHALRIERFWSPDEKRSIVFRSDREYVEGFLEVFGEAVRARLRCDGPVGIMLSGGLDSSSVATVAAAQMREQGNRLSAFHAAPRSGSQGAVRLGKVADESADVEAIARMHPNIDLRIHRTGRTPFDEIEMSFRMTGAPARNPSNVGWFDGIYAAAKTEGVRVMLAGHKGNSTISYTGMRSLADSARKGHWSHLWREVQALGLATGKGRRYILKHEVVRPLTPPLLAGLLQRLTRTPHPSTWETTASAIKPEVTRIMQVEERLRAGKKDQLSARRWGELEFR